MKLLIQRLSAFIILKDTAILSSSDVISICTLSPDVANWESNFVIFANMTIKVSCYGFNLNVFYYE